MAANITVKNPIARLIDQCFWLTFLLMVITFSILTGRFDTGLWQIAVGVFFVIFVTYILVQLILEMPTNINGLRAAVPILCLMFAMPFWLLLQATLPGSTERLFADEIYQMAPQWWRLDSRISVTPVKTVWLGLSYMFLACWSLFAMCLLNSRLRVKQLLWLLFFIALIHAIAGIFAVKTSIYFVDKSLVDGHFDVARGLFVNRNHYAASLILGASAGIGLVCYEISKIISRTDRSAMAVVKITAVLLGLLVVSLAILASQSRAAVLAPTLVLGILFCVFILPRLGFKLGLLIVTIFFIVVSTILLSFGDQWLSRVSTEAFSLGERWLQWKVTLGAISHAPVLGYGGGSYGVVFQMVRDHGEFRQVIYNQSHNQFLHIWLEQGLVGLLIWTSLLVLFFHRLTRSFRKSSSRLVRSVSLGGLIAISSMILQSVVDFNLQNVSILSAVYLFLALAFAIPHVNQRKVKRH